MFFLTDYVLTQRVEVFSPPGCLVGTIEQDWSILTPIFTIRNAANEEVLKMEGPICRFSMCGSDVEFKVIFFQVSIKNEELKILIWF